MNHSEPRKPLSQVRRAAFSVISSTGPSATICALFTRPSSRSKRSSVGGNAGVDLVAAPDIALHRQRVDAPRLDVRGRLLDLFQGPAGGDDRGTLGGGGQRNARTDALTGPGHEHDLAIESTHDCSPAFRLRRPGSSIPDDPSGYRCAGEPARLA